MTDSLGPALLMLTVAVLFAAGFTVFWLRDKGRADDMSDDPGRAQTGHHLGPDAREGAAQQPPEQERERRH